MPRYRIHRIKETPRENFRWVPHTGGEATVKLKDYEVSRIVEAATPYAAWKLLADENEPLAPGDLLETFSESLEHEPEKSGTDQPQLLITKYIGFDPAKWFIPEPKKTDTRIEVQALSSEPQVIPAQS